MNVKDIIVLVLKTLIPLLLGWLTVEQLKKFADMAFDFVEDAVAATDNPYDDAIVLPVIARLREAYDIPDNDEPEVPVE